MDKYVEDKIRNSIADRKRFNPQMTVNCRAFKDFLGLQKNALTDGALGGKVKELMALAVSIVTKCEPCIEWHVEQAYLQGATDEEFYETIDVSVEMGGGPASAYARYALNALEFFKTNKR